MRRIIRVPQGPQYDDSYPLSQGVETETMVFANGMAFDNDTRTRMAAAVTIADETRIVLDALTAILADAGASLEDVVKTTVYLSERSFYDEMNSIYRTYWAPGDFPTRATVYVGIGSECRVEIDVIAVKKVRP
ncbi:RidA family protein [Winogradskya consettensis]|uniref:Reactive intermediate/imine deaminase n=2 Tax=Winogradskya TaxID=3240235 RepID=A0A919ST95_9ACTN|nr:MULTISPECIES: RidA family protein [Actinoplanes]GIE23177.1 reactive intermediate/imine deaminase [Actinoplanes humidus]GIM76533.1 reactive intermediate/imine deaminase [Actinoplanes consettensis]